MAGRPGPTCCSASRVLHLAISEQRNKLGYGTFFGRLAPEVGKAPNRAVPRVKLANRECLGSLRVRILQVTRSSALWGDKGRGDVKV